MSDQEIEKLKNNSDLQQNVDNSSKAVDKSEKKQGLVKSRKKSTGQPKKNGGARPGAGRPKGKMNALTIEKMKIKKEFEDRVAHHAHTLFNAQMTLAMGTQFLLKRTKVKNKKGWRWTPFEKVTEEQEMIDYLDGKFKDDTSQYFLLTAEKPDSKAIDSLLDRGFGKAAQSLTLKDERPDPIEEILKKFDLLDDEGNPTGNARQTQSSS